MTEIKFKEGSWNPDDIKDIKNLTEWCKVQDGVIEKGVCMTHGSELAFDDRITIKMPYGDHIPLKDKTGNKGRTKNIEYIGARNVFGVDYDTAEVDYDAITQDKIEDAWKDDLDLFIGQGRDQQWIGKVKRLASIAGVDLLTYAHDRYGIETVKGDYIILTEDGYKKLDPSYKKFIDTKKVYIVDSVGNDSKIIISAPTGKGDIRIPLNQNDCILKYRTR